MSHSNQRKPVMVFISNLRTLADMVELFPSEWHQHVQAARLNPGYIASPAFDIKGVATGYLVLMLRSGEEVIKDKTGASSLVMEMTRHAAEDLDADVIGLGSLTTSITDGGRAVATYIDANGWKIRATHGDTGSTAAIRDCVDLAGIRTDQTIAIVGAYGVIGSALSRMFASEGRRLIAIGPRPDKLAELVQSIRADAGRVPDVVSSDLASVSEADCVITVTSHHEALLKPEHVKPGAVVIDPAIPANVRSDPRWFDVGLGAVVISNASQVRIPGVAVHSGMFGTFQEPDGCATSYACFAETMLNAVHGDREHHVGPIDPAFLTITRGRFASMKFGHAVPRMFGTEAGALIAAHNMRSLLSGRMQ